MRITLLACAIIASATAAATQINPAMPSDDEIRATMRDQQGEARDVMRVVPLSRSPIPMPGNPQGSGRRPVLPKSQPQGMSRPQSEIGSALDAQRRAAAAIQGASPVASQTVAAPDLPGSKGSFDMAEMITAYENLGKNAPETGNKPVLKVFLSFSIPESKLKQYLEQASESHAEIVMRGTEDGSFNFTKMQNRIFALKPTKTPLVKINPNDFKQFEVSRVPAIVLTQTISQNGLSAEGCAPPSKYMKVIGEVSISEAITKFKTTQNNDLKQMLGVYLAARGN